jgi:TatA/E family protein of Tat protein translocase
MGPLGIQETVFIFVLALLIFGPKKLPELGRTIGKAMTEFRRASSELKATFDREMRDIERENESVKELTQKYANDVSDYDSYYDSGKYGSDSYDYNTADYSSNVSASATEGAEQPAEKGSEAGQEHQTASVASDPNSSDPKPTAEQEPDTRAVRS